MDRLPTTVVGSGDVDMSQQPPTTTTTTNNAGRPSAPAGREMSSNVRSDAHQQFPSRPTAASSTASSAASSPLPSREPSPSRSLRASIAAARIPSAGPGTRSRKNSQQDLSPSRPPAKVSGASSTSALPQQLKIITAASTPSLLPFTPDPSIKAPVPQKSAPALLLDASREAPKWPVSPRLRSPPPVLNKPNLGIVRKASEQQDPPSISFQRPTPPTVPSEYSDAEADDSQLQAGTRTPARGGSTSTLETVQEVSPLGSPSPQGIDAALEKLEGSIISDAGSQVDLLEISATKQIKACAGQTQNESGSESGSVKLDRRPTLTSAPPTLTARQSSSSTITKPSTAAVGKGPKPVDSTVKMMTVETETVTSIPQVSVAPAGLQGSNGSLRTKPSSETIRPKKEKKKSNRKQQMIQSGAASSKADNFEAKIASAVDEADTSDSEETFVYDSNPPDGRDRPHHRFHSRTPSATSMASQIDRSGMRSIHTVMEAGHGHAMTSVPGGGMAMKKKKFSNTYSSAGVADGAGLLIDEDGGSGRGSGSGSGRGATVARHPHHIGLWGRNGTNGGGNGHTYLFDNENSPFLGHARTRISGAGSTRVSPAPPSPRFGSMSSARGGGKRGPHHTPAVGYDLDDTTTGADDERTPLIPASMRSSPRTRRGGTARYHHSLMSDHHHRGSAVVYRQHQRNHQPSLLNRMASCLVLTVMLLLVVSGAIGFMFATSQPLTNLELVKMSNVIASEQELMFDMTIKAQNPNVVLVSVDSSDLEIFAKSPHGIDQDRWQQRATKTGGQDGTVGSFATRRVKGRGAGQGQSSNSGDDSGDGSSLHTLDDPIDDPPPDDQGPLWRLGTVRELDQPFSFEGSFFNKGASVSTGGLRLQNPGNGTEGGGSARWARIIENEFDLVVKGVLKYSLPLSQRVRTIAVSGRTHVKPNSANDPKLTPKKPLAEEPAVDTVDGRR